MRVSHDDRARSDEPAAARPRTRRRTDPTQPTGPTGSAGEITRLQRAAGNRAVSSVLSGVLGGMTVQRHPEATMPAEVGEPTPETETAAPTTTDQAVEPGTGTGTGTGGTRAPAAPSRQAQVYAKLNTTDTGRWALGVIDKWSIPVDYNFAGVGSFHRAGKIFVNRSLSIDAAAIVTMHEAQHANTFKSGNAADVESLTRAEFVKRKIADEAEAVVRQIEGSVPMITRGASLAGSGINEGLIDRYRAAFYAKRDELEAADPSMTRAEINRRCRIFARDTEVTSWFHDGTFITSTGGAAAVTYTQHYGGIWDGAHTSPSPSPAPVGAGA